MKAKTRFTNLGFLLPTLILFCVMVVYPFIKGVRISFTDWDGFSNTYQLVGFDNYIKLFTDSTIIEPIKNSLFYTVVTVIGDNEIGLLIALLLKKDTRINRVIRTCVFMPFIISLVLTGFIWSYIYDFQTSLIIAQKDSVRTIPLTQYFFFGEYNIELNMAFAAFVLAMIPIIILYLIMQKYIISGVMAGAVKG